MKEYLQKIDKKAYYRINGLKFPVIISNVRRVFRRIDYLIVPIDGKGEKWVDENSISFIKE